MRTFAKQQLRGLSKISRSSRIADTLKKRALFMPILSFYPVYRDHYDGCKDVKRMMQNHLADLFTLRSYRGNAPAAKALRLMSFYVSVPGC